MPISGVQAFAKCTSCGTVMWTEVHADESETYQSCTCKCGTTVIANTTVIGDADPNFNPTSLEDLLAAEEAS